MIDSQAKNEGETWRIVNEIVKPCERVTIVINGPNGEVTNESEVADIFNSYFVTKISNLKEKIDSSLVKDPLEKLREKMKDSVLVKIS